MDKISPLQVPPDATVVDEYGITPRQRDFANSLYSELVESSRMDYDQYDRMKDWRKAARGRLDEDELESEDVDKPSSNQVRANLIHSRFVSQASRIVARNPEASVSPAPRVDEESYSELRGFTQTAEIYINHEFESGRIKKALRKQVRSTKETSVGWIKAFYQEDYFEDPLIKYRNDDAQDNIAQLQSKLELAENGELELAEDEYNTLMGEIQSLQEGIIESQEIEVSEGWVFEKWNSDDVMVSCNIDEISDYVNADWIATRTFMPAEKAAEMFQLSDEVGMRRLLTAKTYSDKNDRDTSLTNEQGSRSKSTDVSSATQGTDKAKSKKLSGDVCIIEMQHRRHRAVYTFIEGVVGFARAPMRPKNTSQHWYDLFLLVFNDTDSSRYPLSDVELSAPLQEEYNQTRSDLRTHRNSIVPCRIGRKSDIKPEDARAINNAEPNELVLIDGNDDPTVGVQNAITQLQYSQIDPQLYDVGPSRQDLDQVLGSPDLDAGVQVGDRTATAAAIQNEGLQSRSTAKQDAIEDVVTEVARHMLQVSLQRVSYEQVVTICGDGAVWPGYQPQYDDAQKQQMAMAVIMQQPMPDIKDPNMWINDLQPDEIYKLCMVEIRGGSSGKPNKQMEQDQWMQMYPLIKDSVAQIAQFRASGTIDLANAETELLKEFLRRMDEKLDVERFLPAAVGMMMPEMMGGPMGMQAPPGQPVRSGIPLPPL